jgi:hypothetical protein
VAQPLRRANGPADAAVCARACNAVHKPHSSRAPELHIDSRGGCTAFVLYLARLLHSLFCFALARAREDGTQRARQASLPLMLMGWSFGGDLGSAADVGRSGDGHVVVKRTNEKRAFAVRRGSLRCCFLYCFAGVCNVAPVAGPRRRNCAASSRVWGLSRTASHGAVLGDSRAPHKVDCGCNVSDCAPASATSIFPTTVTTKWPAVANTANDITITIAPPPTACHSRFAAPCLPSSVCA